MNISTRSQDRHWVEQYTRDWNLTQPSVYSSPIMGDLTPLPERSKHRPIPPALRKRGIERLETNLPPGMELAVSAKLIVTLFGRQLLQRIAAELAAEEEKRHANL
ncbi:MAG: hypothetical protein ABTR07_05860 [Candidatus Competibacter denitrificans]